MRRYEEIGYRCLAAIHAVASLVESAQDHGWLAMLAAMAAWVYLGLAITAGGRGYGLSPSRTYWRR